MSIIGKIQILAFQVTELNALICQDAGKAFLIASGVIAVIVVLLGIGLKLYLNRRLVAFWNALLLPLILVVIVTTVLVAMLPDRMQNYLDCIGDPEFSRYIIFAAMGSWTRGMVLGGAVAAVLYFLLLFIIGLISGKRKP